MINRLVAQGGVVTERRIKLPEKRETKKNVGVARRVRV
jgi:hypothetical protein